jgi:hypothetical protein
MIRFVMPGLVPSIERIDHGLAFFSFSPLAGRRSG